MRKRMKASFQSFTTNLVGMVRNETLEGREYLAVPMVMMVEGVIHGSEGPLFYPAEELEKIPQVWNLKPVIIYHPQVNGRALSACDQDVIENYKVGIIMNATFDGRRLKAEAWLEPDRLTLIDDRILEALNKGEMMEVSTGVFTENEEVSGVFGGVAYNAIARNLRPDHLAILPDQIGACSIEDGAGLLRVNVKSKGDILRILNQMGINAELSHDEIRSALYQVTEAARVGDTGFEFWIEEVFDDWFVYSQSGDYFKQGYKMTDDEEAQLEGLPVQVERKIVYEITSNKGEGGPKMDKTKFVDNLIEKTKFVDNLIENSKWTEEDRKFLLSLNEAQLTKMETASGEEDPNKDGDGPGAPNISESDLATFNNAAARAAVAAAAIKGGKEVSKEGEGEAGTEEPTGNAKPVSAEEFLASAPSEIREVLNEAMQTQVEKKAELITTIIANEKNVLTKEQLSSMNMIELKAMSLLAKKDPLPAHNFVGMAPVGTGGPEEEEEPLLAPVMNFETPASQN